MRLHMTPGAANLTYLIGIALQHSVCLGLPALFVTAVEPYARELRAAFQHFEVLAAPASVYGAGLKAGLWNINSSEI